MRPPPLGKAAKKEMVMSFQKVGTLCVAVGGHGENAGRIVQVICYVGLQQNDAAFAASGLLH